MYITYARKYCTPRLSEAARQYLQTFYLSLRRSVNSNDCVPITTRQLEALIRLTEARAKCELRDIATEEDAKEVVEIMQESMKHVLEDEAGQIDYRRSASGMSKSKQATTYIKALHRRALQKQSNEFTGKELYTIGMEINLKVDNFDTFIQNLNQQNFLLHKGGRRYQLQTVTDY